MRPLKAMSNEDASSVAGASRSKLQSSAGRSGHAAIIGSIGFSHSRLAFVGPAHKHANSMAVGLRVVAIFPQRVNTKMPSAPRRIAITSKDNLYYTQRIFSSNGARIAVDQHLIRF